MPESRSSQPSQVGDPSRDDQVTVSEALAMLKIGRSTLYRLIQQGVIPAVRGAGPIRLHRKTVRGLAPREPE